MSKVEDLRLKYPKVTKATFNKFVDADFTPTKKYLEFMLRTWVNRENVLIYVNTSVIIDIVKKFDDLLPYITNKDIYHKEYADLALLRFVIDNAEIAKDDKTFNRDEHVNVLLENDRFLLIQPVTHRGSLKYGAGTKWCTAGRNDPNTFTRYSKNGFLAYLIDKSKTKEQNYVKVAFYHEYNDCAFNGDITTYNVIDNTINVNQLKNGKWTEDELFQIFTAVRYYFMKMKLIKKDKDIVDSFVGALTGLNFEQFEKSLTNLDDADAKNYTSSVKNKVDEFLTKLNKTQYAIRETKN
jgi:hypothetical protein